MNASCRAEVLEVKQPNVLHGLKAGAGVLGTLKRTSGVGVTQFIFSGFSVLSVFATVLGGATKRPPQRRVNGPFGGISCV